MLSDNQCLKIIRLVSLKTFPGCKIVLFGSRARNEAKYYSDYDILLIVEQTLLPKEKILYRSQIRKELIKHKILADILIHSSDEVKVKSQLTGHIVKTIINEGIEI